MAIQKTKFPNHLLILPNTQYFLSQLKTTDDLLKIVGEIDCAGLARVLITSIGAFGFIFDDSGELASIDALRFTGGGRVPEKVINNENELYQLQENRIAFINFVSAAFFGRISAKKQTALTGALYNGQDKVMRFGIEQGMATIQWIESSTRDIEEKIEAFNLEEHQSYFLQDSDVNDAISYVHHLLQRQNDFEYAELKSCMVMNYQAAILHNQQHAAASLALNFSVIESLVGEIFHSYGLIEGTTIKLFATQIHEISKISITAFNGMSLRNRVEILNEGGLISDYLRDRIDCARKKRNKLMHKGDRVSPKDSGECQTIVRDLWAFCINMPFELNMSWSYRR